MLLFLARELSCGAISVSVGKLKWAPMHNVQSGRASPQACELSDLAGAAISAVSEVLPDHSSFDVLSNKGSQQIRVILYVKAIRHRRSVLRR